ncbi:cytochrome P450 [Sphingobium sp. B11D3B]|uniref:cytochrome P450 n=1 Tax=Sphingobium sp. B11D3B TaxID=2940575 RepID=UPI002227EEA0|nr:cytochrome P450 [Sphingobium sp. B11D3B]MCW2389595.1 cytochrome P450 [Sphingobium sp. B11D3B]
MADSVRHPRTLTLGLGFLLRIKRDQLAFYDHMKSSYGDAVPLRLGPYRSWLLFHPDHVEQVLTKQWQCFVRFEKLTRVVAQWTGDNMLLAEGDAWRERRRKVLPAFQTRRLPAYCAKAVEHARLLCDRLAKQADKDGLVRIDTDAIMARLTLDIASSTFFASAPPVNGEEVERAIQILSDTAFRESTSPFTLPEWLPLAAKRRKRWAMQVMDELVGDLVDARLRQDDEDHGDLLSMLIEQHEGDRQAVRNDAMSLLIAGHETSGALLSWIFHCLARSPDWLESLTSELAAALNGRKPVADDLASLPILRAVVEEVLRLYPPAYSLFLRRAVQDVAMDGFTIRKGDLVQITPYALHRDQRWFAEPTRFDPTRFLKEASWPRYAYLPFGNGPRVCIGQSFGMMEACLVTATLLQRWVPSETHGIVTPAPKFSLRPSGGLQMTWRAAKQSSGAE